MTTVNQPKEELGKCAAQLLLRIFENSATAEKIVLPTELIVRESTATPQKMKN